MSQLSPLPTTEYTAPLAGQPSNTLNSLPLPVPASEGASVVKTSLFASKPLVFGVVAAVVAHGVGIGAVVNHNSNSASSSVALPITGLDISAELDQTGQLAGEQALAMQAAAEVAAAQARAAELAAKFPFEVVPFGETRDYLSATWENTSVPTTGKVTVDNFRIIESDATHEFTEGYEWRIADIKMNFSDGNARNLGYRYHYLYSVDYYSFDLNNDLDSDGDGIDTVIWNGEEYEVFTTVDLGVDWNGRAFVGGGQWAVHAPIGYDGALLAFFNPANAVGLDEATTGDMVDGDTLWFRMQ